MAAPVSRESIPNRLPQIVTDYSPSSSSTRQRQTDAESPTAGLAPTPSALPASSAPPNLSNIIATITIEDIKNAERRSGDELGDIYILTHQEVGKLALRCVRTYGTKDQIASQIRLSTGEAKTWQRLVHPNVLPFLEVLEKSNDVYTITPFIENGSLSAYVRRHPDVDRTRLIQEAAAGVTYLHRVGIIHGDIKGANILVSDDVHALPCDFGQVRHLPDATSAEVHGVGTIRWTSPELFHDGPKTFKSDVWAFAMTIYEILSGRVPFDKVHSEPFFVIAIVVNKQRPPREPASSPKGTSYASLWDVAQDGWNEDPDRRPDMQEAYDRLISGGLSSLSLSRRSSVSSNDRGSTHSPTSAPVGFDIVGDELVPEGSSSIQAITLTSENPNRETSITAGPQIEIVRQSNNPPPPPGPQRNPVGGRGVWGVGRALVRLLVLGISDPES